MLEIKIKYSDGELIRIEKVMQGDWVDLRAAERTVLKKGEFKLIPLGVAMELPEGYEANKVPRSSTFKQWGILQTNHFSVVDNSYKGDDDWWFYPVYATRDTIIEKNDRICQFRIQKIMPQIKVTEVESLDNPSRGGHGSTGVK